MNLYQIILATTASIFLVVGTMRFLKHQKSQTFFKLCLTYIIWGGIFAISIFPNISYTISKIFGLGQNLNTLIFIGFVTIFVIIFRLLHTIERLEKNISEIVRKEALEKIKTK